MTQEASARIPETNPHSARLALLLAAAMFVLVVDTSLMNVSISAVVEDLDTTVSGVQSAIALEALVSAAFILISSKVGDLIGRKRAYVLGLLAYAIGALAMTLAQSLTAIIIFWAIVGASARRCCCPPCSPSSTGTSTAPPGRRPMPWWGPRPRSPPPSGRCSEGSSRRFCRGGSGFGLEVVIIAVVLAQIKLVRDVPYTGPRHIDLVGAASPSWAWAASSWAVLVWQEGGEFVGALIAIGAVGLAALAYWLVRRKRQGKPTLIDPDLFRFPHFRIGITQQMLQQITLGGAMIVLPIFLQMTLEYNAMQAGLSLAPLSLSMFAVAMLAGRKAGKRRASSIVLPGSRSPRWGLLLIIPLVPERTSAGGSSAPCCWRDPGWACWCPS